MAEAINYNKVHFVASYGKASQIPPSTCPEVSFVGRSNVGKSSIMNKLFNRRSLVKVFEHAGQDRQRQLLRGGRCALCRPARLRLCPA